MRNKKIILLIIGLVLIIIVATMTLIYKSNNRSVDKLLNQLETAINTCDKNKLIDCYPSFIQDEMDTLISEQKMEEFHTKVGDIEITDYIVSHFNHEYDEETESQIKDKRNISVDISGYELVAEIHYHDSFGEPTFEVIKIKNKWYLYTQYYHEEPISYFFN